MQHLCDKQELTNCQVRCPTLNIDDTFHTNMTNVIYFKYIKDIFR